MADFITLTCPTCGGKLRITPDLDRFACTHCGNEHVVKRSEGVVALQPLAESLGGLKRATDRTASEMALRRLADELADLKEARARAERRIEECRQALKDRERARRELFKSVMSLSMVFAISFLWPLPLQLGGVIGSLAEAQTDDLVVWLILPAAIALIGLAVIRRRLTAPALRRPRAGIQADVSKAQEDLRSVDEAISKVNAEQAHHRGFVTLNG